MIPSLLQPLPFALAGLVFLAPVVGCSEIVVSSGTGGADGTGGDGGTSGDGGTDGDGGSIACGATKDRAEMSLTGADGKKIDCSGANPPDDAMVTSTLTGTITEVTADGFSLDTCSPDADCLPTIATMAVSAPGLTITMPVGAFVQVDFSVQRVWVCTSRVIVTALPTWGDVTNPVGPTGGTYLVVSEGADFDDAPVGITPVALGCRAEAGGCGGSSEAPDDYALDVGPRGGAPLVRAAMGSTVEIDLAQTQQPQRFRFRNLRSYVTGYCDDYWNWAYWLAWKEPK